MKEFWVILLIITGLVVRELWILLPASYETTDPFPFTDIQITERTYWSYPLRFASEMMWTAAIYIFITRFRLFFNVLFVVQLIEIIDYFYTYNEPWFESELFNLTIPVGMTVTKFIVLTVTIIIQWILSFYNKQSMPEE